VASALRCYLLIRGSHPIASPWQVVRRNPLRKEWLWYFRVTRTAWFPGGSQRGWEQAPRTPRGRLVGSTGSWMAWRCRHTPDFPQGAPPRASVRTILPDHPIGGPQLGGTEKTEHPMLTRLEVPAGRTCRCRFRFVPFHVSMTSSEMNPVPTRSLGPRCWVGF